MTPAPVETPPRDVAFAELYERFAQELPRWLRWFGVAGAEHEDAVQEAIVAIWTNASDVMRDPRGPRVAMLRLAHAVAQRVRRGAARRRRREFEAAELTPSQGVDVERSIELVLAIEALRQPYRQAVILCDVYEYTVAQAAVEMRAPVPSVKNWLARGRADVRREVDRRSERAGLIIAPFALGLDPVTRASFAALHAAEGRAPSVGGPGGPSGQPPAAPAFFVPLPPPPANPWIVAAITGGVFLTFGVIVGLAVLFVPRPVKRPPMIARAGLYVPEVRSDSAPAAPAQVAPVEPAPRPTQAARGRVRRGSPPPRPPAAAPELPHLPDLPRRVVPPRAGP
ncbi:sigma-70 family RNA polymerase sigma factor [Polyangium sp. 6x1]|uniref:RNA polymerase sigma factor n=1 Tax=Polyangium sp. 6x1 TaxID=3042689 RepID=UPI0024823AA2|nr:sigma-70 family RNA polymerase sigma factor [Polyangium sp. 6x1]MDI1444643.1 sigma-70 family RNA polymerase sigma factor [Polyangium sp. 6x1]